MVSITQFHGGEATNVIPATVRLQGTARSYTPGVQQSIEEGLRRLAAGTAASYGLEAQVAYRRGYPATINSPREATFAHDVLTAACRAVAVREAQLA